MTDPVVTIVIAAWNAQATLGRAIDSALGQTLPVEVIVVDDASTDGTADLADARATSEPRLKVLRQGRNAGPSAARNRAMGLARAPWVAVLDSDDFMDPDRTARLVRLAEADGADFVADDLWKEPEGGGPRHRMFSDGPIGLAEIDAASFVRGNLSSRQGGRREMGFLKPLMSRAFLQRHDLGYDPAIRLGEDFVLYARALLAGARFLLTDPMGYVAVVRPDSLSGTHPTEAHARLIEADRAMLDTPAITPQTVAALRAHMMEQRKKWAWRRMIDAVNASDPKAAAACFWAPPQVGADLLTRLGREIVTRTGRRLGSTG